MNYSPDWLVLKLEIPHPQLTQNKLSLEVLEQMRRPSHRGGESRDNPDELILHTVATALQTIPNRILLGQEHLATPPRGQGIKGREFVYLLFNGLTEKKCRMKYIFSKYIYIYIIYNLS